MSWNITTCFLAVWQLSWILNCNLQQPASLRWKHSHYLMSVKNVILIMNVSLYPLYGTLFASLCFFGFFCAHFKCSTFFCLCALVFCASPTLIGPVCVTVGCDLVNSGPCRLSPSHHLWQIDNRKRKYQHHPSATIQDIHRLVHTGARTKWTRCPWHGHCWH